MGISYSFVDNIIYGTEDINDIARSLVGAGVAPFVSKESYSVSDLNALTEALVGDGVQLDGCKCSCNVEDGTRLVTVSEGILFFENGVRLVVDSDGYLLETEVNSAGYVYGHFNEGLQVGEILFSDEVPADGCVVLLAHIDAKNNLTDRRTFSRSKVGTLGRNITREVEFTPKTYSSSDKPYFTTTVNNTKYYKYALGTADIDLSRFNFVFIKVADANICGTFDLKKNVFLVSAPDGGDRCLFNTGAIYLFNSTNLGFEVVDDALTYYGYCQSGNEYSIQQIYKKTFKLLFM